MIHFNSLACQQAFMAVCLSDKDFLPRCFRMLNRDVPCELYLVLGRQDEAGKYFDFGVFRTQVDEYKDRPDLSVIKPFVPDRSRLIVNGGLVRHESGWSSHT